MRRVLEAQRTYLNAVKSYVRDQYDVWNEVPYWAAQANGVTGYLDKYSVCYNHGLWQLSDYCFVDCGSAELVGWGSNGAYPALDSFILDLKVERLDASKIVNELKQHSQRTPSKHIGTPSYTLLAAKQAPLKYVRTAPVSPLTYAYY